MQAIKKTFKRINPASSSRAKGSSQNQLALKRWSAAPFVASRCHGSLGCCLVRLLKKRCLLVACYSGLPRLSKGCQRLAVHAFFRCPHRLALPWLVTPRRFFRRLPFTNRLGGSSACAMLGSASRCVRLCWVQRTNKSQLKAQY